MAKKPEQKLAYAPQMHGKTQPKRRPGRTPEGKLYDAEFQQKAKK